MSNSHYWIDEEKNTVLIWSPKCACSSLHTGFIRYISKIDDNEDPRHIAHKKNYCHHNYSKIPKNFVIYWGIRDPFDRVVSCYFNKFIVHSGKRLNENNLESFSQNLLEQIGVKYEDLTFNKFLYGIQDLMSKKIPINHHFNTQINLNNYNIIKDYPNLIIFDIKNIPTIFGKQIINSTPHPKNAKLADLCDTKSKDININDLEKKNFTNSKELIKKIYSLDYEIFNKHNIIY